MVVSICIINLHCSFLSKTALIYTKCRLYFNLADFVSLDNPHNACTAATFQTAIDLEKNSSQVMYLYLYFLLLLLVFVSVVLQIYIYIYNI